MTTGGLEGLGVLRVSGPRLPALTGGVKAKIRHTVAHQEGQPAGRRGTDQFPAVEVEREPGVARRAGRHLQECR